MDIAIFGASGATGTLLTQRCLAAGHSVGALLRTTEKFPLRYNVFVKKAVKITATFSFL